MTKYALTVVANPNARSNRKKPGQINALKEAFYGVGVVEAPASLQELQRLAQTWRAAPPDVLAIHGGDGTIHQTLSALVHAFGEQTLPTIALLRGGTLNTITRGLGIREASAVVTQRLIQRLQWNVLPTFTHPWLRVEDKVACIFGNGVVTNFLDLFYRDVDPTVASSVWLMARGIGSTLWGGPLSQTLFERVCCEVEADGSRWQKNDFLSVGAATVAEIGLGFRPFHHVQNEAETFALLGIYGNMSALCKQLPRTYRGLAMSADLAIEQTAKHVRIASHKPFNYTLDGDVYTASLPLNIRMGPTFQLVDLR